MSAMIAFGGLVGVIALAALASIWKGYVLTVLWAWFVVPIFGLPVLSLAPAIGISLMVSFLTHQSDATTAKEGTPTDRFAKSVSHALIAPAVVLGIGWVVNQFM